MASKAPAATDQEVEDGREKFTFFFGPQSPFSQHYVSEFDVDGVTYNCAEQYMMHRKAVLFGDEAMAAAILRSSDPKEQKRLGRKVSNFDEGTWKAKCKDIVRTASRAKFRQNAELLSALTATEGTTMVEASPYDRVWGIGLSATNQKAKDRRQWRGTNWLGEILTQVREELIRDK